MQEQHRLLQQPLRRIGVPDHALPRQRAGSRLPPRGHGLRGAADHDRRRLRADLGSGSLPTSWTAGISASRRSSTMPSRYCCLTTASASPPDPTAMISTSVPPRQSCQCVAARFVRRHQQQFLGAPLQRVLDGVERGVQVVLGDRLFQVSHGAQRQAAAPVFVAGDDVHRNVPRGRIVLQPVENRPAGHIGQADVERDGARLELARQRQRGAAAQRHQRLDAAVVRQVHQDAREGDIVLDDQQHRDRPAGSGCGRHRFRYRAPRRRARGWAAAE